VTTDAIAEDAVCMALPRDPTDHETQSDGTNPATDAERSAANILQWTSYLPADCIKTMIAMGWDRTT
jgi:hypothetical protein